MDMFADRLRGRRALWLVLALALALRVVYVFEIDQSPLFAHPAVDSKTYTQQALKLAAGNWLGVGQGPFWQPPLYPYFLGAVKALFPDGFFHAARLIQALMGALVCAMTWWIGRYMFGSAVGFCAGIGAACYGPLIFFDGELLPAALSVFLNMAALVILLAVWRRPTGWGLLGAGAAFGLGAVVVPTVLMFSVMVPIDLLRRFSHRQGFVYTGIFLLGVALPIAPVAARNAYIGGDGVGISYNMGINFYIGNNPAYEETVAIRPGWEWDALVTRPAREGIERPAAKSAYFMEEAMAHIAADPLWWMGLMMDKMAAFWHGDEVGRNQPIYYWRNYSGVLSLTLWKWGIAFPFGLVGPLALWGLLLSLRRIGATMPLMYAISYCLGVAMFFVAARYRVPVLPILLVFAAYGLGALYRWARSGRWRHAGLGLAVCIAFSLAANRGLGSMDMDGDAAIHYNLGNAYAKAGDRLRAHAAFERAVALDPDYDQAWLNLAGMKGAMGDLDAAADIFARLTRSAPTQAEPWLNMAHVRIMQRDIDGAIAAYEAAIAAEPQMLPAYVEMIRLFGQFGDLARAAQVVERAGQALPQQRERLRQLYRQIQGRTLGR